MIKNSESEFNTRYTKKLVCPYCGYENHADSEDYGNQDDELESDCSKCQETFIYITDYDVTFCTAKKQKEPVE